MFVSSQPGRRIINPQIGSIIRLHAPFRQPLPTHPHYLVYVFAVEASSALLDACLLPSYRIIRPSPRSVQVYSILVRPAYIVPLSPSATTKFSPSSRQCWTRLLCWSSPFPLTGSFPVLLVWLPSVHNLMSEHVDKPGHRVETTIRVAPISLVDTPHFNVPTLWNPCCQHLPHQLPRAVSRPSFAVLCRFALYRDVGGAAHSDVRRVL
ncbi:hypothetical protein B0J15DRAFT_290539 [Fusarium solani]|uniref:Uncharacterized protein n=1 Tax=Fusarium solani TaxID=169388 RepID=A0A9P9HK41_FUSSL|nr:uncharacterized protein B0J15DRAFT_290539 [Fusarium solani]KAH7258097.1 hypothetical protein B0J15DRAFT_290539 [Fusarium solani]